MHGILSDHDMEAAEPMDLSASLTVWPQLEQATGTKETNVELQEEVDLSQNDRNTVSLSPSKRQADRKKSPNCCRQNHDARFGCSQVPGQLD